MKETHKEINKFVCKLVAHRSLALDGRLAHRSLARLAGRLAHRWLGELALRRKPRRPRADLAEEVIEELEDAIGKDSDDDN